MATGHKGLVRKRTFLLFGILVFLYVAVGVRLAYVDTAKRQELKGWAERIRYRTEVLPSTRGYIYERDGKRPLAMSIEAVNIYAHRDGLEDIPKTAVRVAEMLRMDPQAVERKLRGRNCTIYLAKRVHPGIGREIMLGYRVKKRRKIDGVWKYIEKREKLPGIGVEEESKRIYPLGSLAAQVLGFTNSENHGGAGVECTFDKMLTGTNGLMSTEVDARRRPIPETRRTVRAPVNGRDVVLTIDMCIQQIAEDALRRMAGLYHPESACAVVLDPRNGDVLALANYPNCNPGDRSDLKKWRNRAVADLYEPGSTLKTVTVAAGLNEGIDPRRPVGYCARIWKVPGGRIPCSVHAPFLNGHGRADMYRIIQYSCNIGAAQLAQRLGSAKIHKYEKAFGLLDRIHAGFGCEAVGMMAPPEEWRHIRLLNIGFGHGIAVTPLQMAAVYSTVANHGVYIQPRFIKEIRNADGSVADSPDAPKPRRVISRQAAAELTKMLMICAEEGTGKPAQIEGRTVAGKTGSAQIAKPRGGYESDFIASFMGFAPASKPRLVIAVVVKRPRGSHWGAVVAAPVFKEIGERSLWYLKVPSDAPAKPKSSPKPIGGGKGLA